MSRKKSYLSLASLLPVSPSRSPSRSPKMHVTSHVESEYPLTEEDAIRAVPVHEEWTVVAKRHPTRILNISDKDDIEITSSERARTHKKQLKVERKAHVKAIVEANKRRWRHGEPDIMEEKYLHPFQKSLANFFRSGYNKYFNSTPSVPATNSEIIAFVNELIIGYGLLISGGYVLKNMGLPMEDSTKKSVDIDIYVPHNTPDKFPDFYETMALLFDCDIVTDKYDKEVYDINKFTSRPGGGGKHSFFRKNGIYSVFKHARNVKGEYAEMDLVRAIDGKLPVNIIRNFDLTVCMNWYNGKDICVVDKPAIVKIDNKPLEPGHLNYTYVPYLLGIKNEQGAMIERSNVTRDRILKYILRGYRITYVDPRTGECIEIVTDSLLNGIQRLPKNKRELYYKKHPHHRPSIEKEASVNTHKNNKRHRSEVNWTNERLVFNNRLTRRSKVSKN